jgi:DNA repair exonuclease SbcCD ATPase subunit
MVKIKKIETQGFLLYNDAEVSFENREGLVALNGQTDGKFDSNGSGKSSLPSLVCQCIYGKNLIGKAQKEIYNKHTNKKFYGKIYIDLIREDSIDELIIERDYSKNFFEYYINDIPSGYSNKVTKQNELEKELGLSFNTFSKLFFLSPQKLSLFSTSEDTAQSNFIKELLSLEFITDINKKADIELKSLKLELDMKVKEQSILQSNVNNLKEHLDMIKHNSVDILDITTKEETLEEIVYNKSKAKKELQEFESEIKGQESKVNELTSSIDFLKKQQTESSKILNLSKCPTCKQEIKNIDSLKGEFENIQEQITELATQRKDLKTNNLGKYKILQGLRTKFEKITKEEILLENEIKRLKEIKANEESSDKVTLRNKLRKDLAKANEEIVSNEIALTEFRDKVYVYELIKACTGAKGFVKERIKLFIELFNGTLSKISSKALGNEINIWVENTSKDTFELVYKEQGLIQRYIDLSSGTQRRVDILLCLALNLSIKTLTNVDINLLFLDEVLSNIDESGKKEVGKLLRYITKEFPNKSIITVHHGETIESDYTLNVYREDNQSTLSWEE